MPIAAADFANLTFEPNLADGAPNPLTSEQRVAFIIDFLDNPGNIRGILFKHREALSKVPGLENLLNLPNPATNSVDASAFIPNAELVIISDDTLTKAKERAYEVQLKMLSTTNTLTPLLNFGKFAPGRTAYIDSIRPHIGKPPMPDLITELSDDQFNGLRTAAANRLFEIIKTNIVSKTILDDGINSFDVPDVERERIEALFLGSPNLFGVSGLMADNLILFSDEQLNELRDLAVQKRSELILTNALSAIDQPDHPIFSNMDLFASTGDKELAREALRDHLSNIAIDPTNGVFLTDPTLNSVITALNARKTELDQIQQFTNTLIPKIEAAGNDRLRPFIPDLELPALKEQLNTIADDNPTNDQIQRLLQPQLSRLQSLARTQLLSNDIKENLKNVPVEDRSELVNLIDGINPDNDTHLEVLRNRIANDINRDLLGMSDVAPEKIKGLTHKQTLSIYQSVANQNIVNKAIAHLETVKDNALLARLSRSNVPERIKETVQENKDAFGLRGVSDDALNKLLPENLTDIYNYTKSQTFYNTLSKAFKYDPNATPAFFDALGRLDISVNIGVTKTSLKTEKDGLFNDNPAITDEVIDSLSDKQVKNIRKLALVRQVIHDVTDANDAGLNALYESSNPKDVRQALLDHFPSIAARLGLQETNHLYGVALDNARRENENVIDDELARDIILQATNKILTLQANSAKDPKKETEKVKFTYDLQNKTIEWMDKLSANEKTSMYNHYKKREHAYKANVEVLSRRAKDLAHSRSRDKELPAFKIECENIYKQLSLVKRTCESIAVNPANQIIRAVNQNMLTNVNNQLKSLEEALHKVNKPSYTQPLTSIKTLSATKEVLDVSQGALNTTGLTREATITEKVNSLLGRNGALPASGAHLIPDANTKGILDENTVFVHGTEIQTGVYPLKKETTVVSVHQIKNGVASSEIHYNKDKISNLGGEDGYLKWAITEIENFRLSSGEKQFKLISRPPNELPKKLVEMMVKYCRLQGYELTNTTNIERKATPSKELDRIDKKLKANPELYFPNGQRPQPRKTHAESLKELSHYRPR